MHLTNHMQQRMRLFLSDSISEMLLSGRIMAALMTSVMDNRERSQAIYITCRQMGIRILPPDINRGVGDFSVDNGNIRYGLGGDQGGWKTGDRADHPGQRRAWHVS